MNKQFYESGSIDNFSHAILDVYVIMQKQLPCEDMWMIIQLNPTNMIQCEIKDI